MKIGDSNFLLWSCFECSRGVSSLPPANGAQETQPTPAEELPQRQPSTDIPGNSNSEEAQQRP